jgi:hypothetical protein
MFLGASGSFTFLVTVSLGSTPGTYSFTESGTGTITVGQYYFSQLAFGAGYQTILTYINYSPQTITCTTTFYGDPGTPLLIPFTQGTISTRVDVLAPGGSIHDESIASLTAGVSEGWAQASCTGPVQASMLYRYYNTSVVPAVPVGEASVNAETAPTTKFVTFAQTATGVAYGNPSATQSTSVTIAVFNQAGAQLATTTFTLAPLAHSAANLGPLLGLSSFTGSVEITATNPIISLSLNAEVFPVFSSLPPGDLPAVLPSGSQTYYFSQLALGSGYQTILTYINYSSQTTTCTTTFYGNTGTPLSIPFSQGTISTRVDTLAPGGSIHDESVASLTAGISEGWAQASCTGPVQASVLYRYYNTSVVPAVPVGEASVNAETAPTTKFVTFAQTATGVAYANPSTTQSTSITFTVFNQAGVPQGSTIVTLGPLAHSAANLGPLLGLSSFTGSVQITSTVPIIGLSLNAEVFPVFSSLPPGDLPSSTTLVN